MVRWLRCLAAIVAACCAIAAQAAASVRLDLSGYADAAGPISVQRHGDTVDPYFAAQALLLAHDSGLESRAYAQAWVDWLLPRQKLDGTFDRYCRRANVWAPCKLADADDALLAMWLRLLETMPDLLATRPAWQRSHAVARAALARLYDRDRGVYVVSPVYLHGLLMDNLEVWSYAPARRPPAGAGKPNLTESIEQVFWDPVRQRYRVSTQPGQSEQPFAFYPDAVAQIFPSWVGYPAGRHAGSAGMWQQWRREHRGQWLGQVEVDFAWGLVAIVALRHGDRESAACWLRSTQAHRHGPKWLVTDEVVAQVLRLRGVEAGHASRTCRGEP